MQAITGTHGRTQVPERGLKALRVACPFCGAGPGELCLGETGVLAKTTHGARRVEARRVEREEEAGGSTG